MPDWLFDALKLPARIIAGLFLGSALILILDNFAVIRLSEIHALAWTLTVIAAVIFGSLSLAAVGGVIYDIIEQRRKPRLLAKRREIRRAEAEKSRVEYESRILKRLDYLSKEEVSYVAACLRKNERSFTAWAHSPHVSNLQAAGLVGTPGGTHDQDHYPFYFVDLAWVALLKRKDEFIAKDDENKRREAAEKGRSRHR
jgi:hypothetical protein